MAGLGCGSYRFSKSVNNNKSYVYVKLTESAHKALEEYLKYRNCSKSQPSIAFNGTEGEIKIPTQGSGETVFKFQMQKVQDPEGPQGSFESLRQVESNCLDSLGPLMSIMRIQAKDDSYEKTRQSMASAMAQNGKTCVKELKPNGMVSRHRPTRPASLVVPPHKKEPSNFTTSSPYSTHNGNTAPANTHTPTAKHTWNQTHNPLRQSHINRKVNEAIKKRPLRERIIHLLALKPMNKLELMQRILAEGVKESDKRHNITSMLPKVASLKDNAYHLRSHLWAEVNEDWPFYSDEEKAGIQRTKTLHGASPHGDSALSTQSPPLSPSLVGSSAPDTLKRSRDPQFDPTVKKSRLAPEIRCPEISNKGGGVSPRGDPGLRDRRSKWPPPKPGGDTAPPSVNGYGGGDSSPPCSTSVSPLSQNNSPRDPSGVKGPESGAGTGQVSNGFVSNAANSSATTRSASNPNGRNGKWLTTTAYPSHRNEPNHNSTNQSSSPTSSPDSQQENRDLILNYREQYSKIENKDQRRQYKKDFNRIYEEYQVLHADLEKTTLFFKGLESSLNEHQYGSPEYHRIKHKMFDEYESRQPSFQEKKQRYDYLDEVLKHIKQHVNDYDASN